MTTYSDNFSSDTGQITNILPVFASGHPWVAGATLAISGGQLAGVTQSNGGLVTSGLFAQENAWVFPTPDFLITAAPGSPTWAFPLTAGSFNAGIGLVKDADNFLIVQVGPDTGSTTQLGIALNFQVAGVTELSTAVSIAITELPTEIAMGLDGNNWTVFINFPSTGWQFVTDLGATGNIDLSSFYDFTAPGNMTGWLPMLSVASTNTPADVDFSFAGAGASSPFVPPIGARVPDMVGGTRTDAVAALGAVGLTVGAQIPVMGFPIDQVTSQTVDAGLVLLLPTVVGFTYFVDETAVVPDVIGLSLSVASAAIVAAGFSVGTTDTPFNNTVPAGQVFAQDPAGGSAEAIGSPVDITVSNGPEPLTVPLIVGMVDTDAASLLGSLLLRGAPTMAFSPLIPAGVVISQQPQAGTPIAQGGVVAYVVSLGPFVPPLISPFDFEPTVMSQFANSATILQLITNMAQYLDVAADFTNFYTTIWNIDSANSYGLDIWGRILGISRVIPIPGDNDSFGFDNSDVPADWATWGNATDGSAGAPFFAGEISTGSFTLDNNAYRTLLLAKALANIASMSAPSLNQLVSNLFPGRGRAYTTNGRNMTMTYVFDFALSTIELAILTSSGVLPNPAGVTVGITVSP